MFAPEERAALAHKASAYCSKLLKRTDQCQAVLACSHLYWQPEAEVGGRVPVGGEGVVGRGSRPFPFTALSFPPDSSSPYLLPGSLL